MRFPEPKLLVAWFAVSSTDEEERVRSEVEGQKTQRPDADPCSFCAQDWARNFVTRASANPAIATDEATMTGWFANAIMRGYDERERRWRGEVAAAGASRVECLEREAILGAVARGWCTEANRDKTMDVELAADIVDELMSLSQDKIAQ